MIVDQSKFRQALLDPESERPIGLVDGQGRPAGRRFDVYRNNVAVSLTEALETAFPVVRKLVGGQNFKVLAGVFLRQNPPSSPLMMFYGDTMPGFLEGFEPTKSIGYLPDIARLELALRESYHAADSQGCDPGALQSMAPDELMATPLQLAPSLKLVRSSWPIFSIWQFNTVEGAAKPQMEAQDVLILRNDMAPEPHLLPDGAGTFLSAILEKQPLGSAFDLASSETSEFDLTSLLASLLGANAITKTGE